MEAYEAALSVFLELMGDIPIGSISKELLFDCKSKLQQLPPNRNKSPSFRLLTIDEVLAIQSRAIEKGETPKTISRRTFNNYCARLSTTLSWAESNGFVERKLAAAMPLPDKPERGSRQTYQPEELQAIFQSVRFKPGGYRYPSNYWLPILALFTGARLNEVCQLHVTDIGIVVEVVYIDVNANAGKKLKNESSRRRIPIHSTIASSFRQFVEAHQATGGFRLFPVLSWTHKDGPGRKAGRYFNDFVLPGVGIKGAGLVFHSLRRTFINALDDAGVEDYIVKRLIGHAAADEASRSYRDLDRISILSREIEKLTFEISLPPFEFPRRRVRATETLSRSQRRAIGKRGE